MYKNLNIKVKFYHMHEIHLKMTEKVYYTLNPIEDGSETL
jgi:hypothetical protein